MYELVDDFSFGLFFWQSFVLLHLVSMVWATVLLLKNDRGASFEKLIWLLSFIFIPYITAVFYIFNYYLNKRRLSQ